MLKTDFKDDIFPGARRYDLVKNEDGTVSLTDKTDYTQEGDKFGASEINEICREMNETKKSVGDGKKLVADAITAKGQVTVADAEFTTMAENIGRIETGANQTNVVTHWAGYENICVETHPIDATQALVTIPNMEAGRGYYDSTSKVTGNIANLNAGNIKAGVKVGRSGAHGADSTNTITGTFTSDATATAPQILQGCTAYVKGNKITGTIPIQNPDVPGTDQAYAISMSNQEGAINLQVRNGYYLNGVNWMRANDPSFIAANIREGVNIGGLVGTLKVQGAQVFNSSGVFTVPPNVYALEVFLVGGGGGGASGVREIENDRNDRFYIGNGGAGGYTKTIYIPVTPGQQFACIVGAGGSIGQSGGASYFGEHVAFGGVGGSVSWGWNLIKNTSNGGSGGGISPAGDCFRNEFQGTAGGTNGSNSIWNSNAQDNYGIGQGSTTKAFGDNNGTVYAGGGGGGGRMYVGGAGGAGGGGKGGSSSPGLPGTPNTGGGGGGGGMTDGITAYSRSGAAGGSGIIIVRWGYR